LADATLDRQLAAHRDRMRADVEAAAAQLAALASRLRE
jgi:hypothetical protein